MTSEFILAPGEEFLQCPYNRAHQITNERLLTHLEKCRRAYLKSLSTEGQKSTIRICRHNAMHHYPAPEIRFHEERCPDAFSVIRHLAYHNSEEGNRFYEGRRRQDVEMHDPNRERKPSTGSTSSSYSHHKKDKYGDREKDRHRGYGERDNYAERGSGGDKHQDEDKDGGWETCRRSKDKRRSGEVRGDHHGRQRDQYRDRRPSTVDDLEPENKPAVNPNQWGLEEEDWESESTGYTPGYDPHLKLKEEAIIYNPSGLTKSERKKFRNEVREKLAERELNGHPVEFPTPGTFEQVEVKPNIKELSITEKIKKEPKEPEEEREPGELSTDDEEAFGEGAAGGQAQTDYKPAGASSSHYHGGYGGYNHVSSTNHHYHNPPPVPPYAAANRASYQATTNYPKASPPTRTTPFPFGMWYGEKDSDNEPDSDDFEGDDPYF